MTAILNLSTIFELELLVAEFIDYYMATNKQ